MVGPQKEGDIYNYRSTAYIASHKIDVLSFLDLDNISFDVKPDEIPKQASTFNQPISFDVIFHSNRVTLFCECKHSTKPKNATMRSIDFKDAFLEFLGAEKYRNILPNFEFVFYVFITNINVQKLKSSVKSLQSSRDEKLFSYIEQLKKRAPKKWPGLESDINITSDLFRRVLQKTIIVTIIDADLDRADNEPKYKDKFEIAIKQISVKNDIHINDVLQNNTNIIKFTYNHDICYIDFVNALYKLYVSKSFIKNIEENFEKVINDFKTVELKNDHLILKDINNLNKFNKILILIKEINNYLNNSDLLFILDYNLQKVYLMNINKLMDTMDVIRNVRGYYDLSMITKYYTSISNNTLKFIIIETMRNGFGIDVRQDMIK